MLQEVQQKRELTKKEEGGPKATHNSLNMVDHAVHTTTLVHTHMGPCLLFGPRAADFPIRSTESIQETALQVFDQNVFPTDQWNSLEVT